MPGMFSISPSVLPAIPTRKALIILDLQNDFVSSQGALAITEPEGLVPRTLELAKAFRASGAGDVVWVRSEFERHRPLSPTGDQIVTRDMPPFVRRHASARGRLPASKEHDNAAMEADDEAFLSVSAGKDKPLCVRRGTPGAEFAPGVKDAVETGRDILFTKTHYSAFAAGQQQLVQLLRSRFVTEMYVCGALTNVSVYATALDAGRHGYDMTIVEDCCGYRSPGRHMNAKQQLKELTGFGVIDSQDLVELLQPAKTNGSSKPASTTEPEEKVTEKVDGGSDSGPKSPVRSPARPNRSTGLSPTIKQLSLNRDGDPSAASPAPPHEEPTRANAEPQGRTSQGPAPPARPVQPLVADRRRSARPTREDALQYDDPTPLEADSDSDDLQLFPGSGSRGSDWSTSRSPVAGIRGDLTTLKVPLRGNSPSIGIKPRVRATTRQRKRQSGTDQTTSTESSPEKKTSTPDKLDKRNSASEKKDSNGPPPSDTPRSVATPDIGDHPRKMSGDNEAKNSFSTTSEPFCEGDTHVITNALSPALAADAFKRLLDEVSWAGMSHMGGEVPRRIAVQGAIDEEGNMPVYRHPADESPPLLPFSPTVLAIKNEIEKHLGHPLNHVLIQHYRGGNDYISEHSDKTLDIVRGSFIANVSLGAERTMVLRTKRPEKDAQKKPAAAESEDDASPEKDKEKARRQIQRAPLPHNSLLRMGLNTNMRWLHAIRQDKRADRDKSAAELAYGGARISLTFRYIGTFLNSAQTHIWGQGATSKTQEGAQQVVNGQTAEAVKMLQAFGSENNTSDFDWEARYGSGFDVLHMGTPKRFCIGSDAVVNMRVALALAEMGIACAKGVVNGDTVRFEDNDPGRTVVDGHATVLRYLDAVYGAGRRYDQMPPVDVAKRFVQLQRGLDLLGEWRVIVKRAREQEAALLAKVPPSSAAAKDSKEKAHASILPGLVKKELLPEWENHAEQAAAATAAGSIATASKKDAASSSSSSDPQEDQRASPFYITGGGSPSPADYALWPVLHDITLECDGKEDVLNVGKGFLLKYYQAFKERSAVSKVLGGSADPAAGTKSTTAIDSKK